MTPTEFRDRLSVVARWYGVSASDLAVWFGRPRPTCRTWLYGTKPQAWLNGHIQDYLAQRLLWLEKAMRWEFVDPDGPMRTRPLTRPELREVFDRERLRSVRLSSPRIEGDPRF